MDLYRALTLIYIVCVIHVVYWLPFDFEPYKGFLLWEMPTIFFIAGASAQYASRKSIKEQIYNRSKRVLIPYYIYAFGSIFILFLIRSRRLQIIELKDVIMLLTDFSTRLI